MDRDVYLKETDTTEQLTHTWLEKCVLLSCLNKPFFLFY